MPKSDELTQKLVQSDPQVQRYVAELEAENEKLQRQIAKFEVQNVSGDNRIKALQQELKESRPEIHMNINTGRISDEELERRADELAARLGWKIIKNP